MEPVEHYTRGARHGEINMLNMLIVEIQKDMLKNQHLISDSSSVLRNYQKELINLLSEAVKEKEKQ